MMTQEELLDVQRSAWRTAVANQQSPALFPRFSSRKPHFSPRMIALLARVGAAPDRRKTLLLAQSAERRPDLRARLRGRISRRWGRRWLLASRSATPFYRRRSSLGARTS